MNEPVRVLVDDVRAFRDGRTCLIARTAEAAVELLAASQGAIDELWLDHDLGGGATVMPVVSWLVEAAAGPGPRPVRRIRVHTSNVVGAHRITTVLRSAGYHVEREYNRALWTREPTNAVS